MPNHSNHDWADCYNNPKSKNFKGTAKNWKDGQKKDEETNLIEQLEEESVSGSEEYNEFREDPQESFLFELLAESSSGSKQESEAEEADEESQEDCEVKQLIERISNKRKREAPKKGETEMGGVKLIALEATNAVVESPEAEFPALEAGSSSLKKKLHSVPMLDYDFSSKMMLPDYSPDKEPPPLDERKPSAKEEPVPLEMVFPDEGEEIDEDLQLAVTQMEEELDAAVASAKTVAESNETEVYTRMEVEEDADCRGASMFGSSRNKFRKEEDYDNLFSMDNERAGDKVPSAEILVAIATESKKVFHTFRGLVDTCTSASLMDRKLIPENEEGAKGGKLSKWKTQAGTFQTQGRVRLKKVKLPQFTTKRAFQAEFHLFDKKESDQYNFILGRDVLQHIRLDVLYSSNVFEWDHI